MKKRKQIILGVLAVYLILSAAAILFAPKHKMKTEPDLQIINQDSVSEPEKTPDPSKAEPEKIPETPPAKSQKEEEPLEEILSSNTVSENTGSKEENSQEEASLSEETKETADDTVYCQSITKRRVNIRETPQMNGKVVGKIEYGKIGIIVEPDQDGWTKVTFGEVTGYCSSELLEIVEPDKLQETAEN